MRAIKGLGARKGLSILACSSTTLLRPPEPARQWLKHTLHPLDYQSLGEVIPGATSAYLQTSDVLSIACLATSLENNQTMDFSCFFVSLGKTTSTWPVPSQVKLIVLTVGLRVSDHGTDYSIIFINPS